MKIELVDNQMQHETYDVFIRSDDKVLKVLYGGNGDLYIDVYEKEHRDVVSFDIEKNDEAFAYFDGLFNDIKNCNIFESETLNKKVKESELYKKIYSNNQIQLYSDSIYDEAANILYIFYSSAHILVPECGRCAGNFPNPAEKGKFR